MALVAFERVPVQVEPTLADAAPRLYDIAHGSLPVLAVRQTTQVEFDTLEPFHEAVAELEASIRSKPTVHIRNRLLHRILDTDTPRDPNSNYMRPYNDVGLHFDGEYSDRIDITVHRTIHGTASAQFFSFQPAILAEYGIPKPQRIYDDATASIARGLIDDEIFVPVCHEAETSPGVLLLFRRGGFDPQAHLFTSSSWRRRVMTRWINQHWTTRPIPAKTA